jgi:signal transduction protein with GAF and PtsI domain
MSSEILKYTSKLNTNLQNIKKRIGEISKKSGEEKNRAILDLYIYFKRDTNVRVNLFTSAGETITRCLTVTECIHRDL